MQNDYDELPDPVKKFLKGLRAEEVDQLQDAIEFMKSVRVVGRFGKWMIITIVSAFIGAAALGDAILKLKSQYLGRMPW